MSGSALRRSPLHDEHVALGAKLVEFGGWDMPLQYPTGTVAEHLACRNDAVVFDVSHLGTVRVSGPDAFDALQDTFTNDLTRIAPGRAQYTHLCDETDGSVVDDIIVWWVAADRFDVMPNASNTSGVLSAIGGVDVTSHRAVLAVQGPRSIERLASLTDDLAGLGRFRVIEARVAGIDVLLATTGYTGELGVEIAVGVDDAATLWRAVLGAGVTPAGLGARDTLRLEAALPLHGHELGPGITPLQASLAWVVAFDKPHFRGRAALLAERERGVSRTLRGIAVPGRRPPRAECAVLAGGEVIGVVTSGNFSPVLGHGIALALVPPSTDVGDAVQIDVRGTLIDGSIVRLPFIAKR